MTQEKKTKRKRLYAFLLCGALLITGAFAFLTATTDTKTNTFTVGSIKVELDEGPWETYPDTDTDGIPDIAEELVSGKVIEKAPLIRNTGSNDAYGFVLVSIPKAESAMIVNSDGTHPAAASENVELFELLDAEGNNILTEGNLPAGWSQVDISAELSARTDADQDSYNHYLFAYDTVIPGSASTAVEADRQTSTLFSKVRFANVTEDFAGATAKELVVKVEVMAIQADSEINSVDSAWTALSNDNDIQLPPVVKYGA